MTDAAPVLDLARHFGAENALAYDQEIHRRIPGYEALHTCTRALLASRLGLQAKILVVAAGTGKELVACARAQPGWTLVGVDPSADMLDIAANKIATANLTDRARLYRGTVEELPPQEPFDAATALLVMHFVPDDASKLSFLRSIARRLKSGATLILADMTGQPGASEFEVLFAAWKAHWCASYDLPADDATAAKEFAERRARAGWIDEPRHFELFAEAGFGEPVCFWAGLLFRAWVMHKL